MYGDDYGSNTILLNWKTAKLICRIKSDGDISDMSASENGKYITTHSSSRIRIWDISKKLEIFKTGDGKRVAIDVPFISNSAFDGKNTLVYSIDNSWATGTIHIHDTGTNKEIACFNSMNGHLAMDINFNDSIIALSGTSKHLILADFQGRDIAHQTNASNSRIHTVNFSPDGSRIAIGGEAGTLIIFKITTNNAKPEISDKQNIVLPHPLDFD
jgi:WD40 repeat protein